MITYMMVVCTAGWVMCGQVQHVPQPTLAACLAERRELYRLQGRSAFKWITCEPVPTTHKAKTHE